MSLSIANSHKFMCFQVMVGLSLSAYSLSSMESETLFSPISYFHSLPVFFPHRAHEDFGLTTQQTSMLLTVLGGTHIIVRPLLGLLGANQTSKQRKQVVLAMAALVNGLINLISISFDSMVTQTIFIIIYGISGG